MYYGFDPTIVLLIPAIIFTMIAQSMVTSQYNKYSKVRNLKNITGAQAARMILDANGLRNVPVQIVNGKLTDHYDPRGRVMRLSPDVYNNPSVASISIAAHESGHAIQHATNYAPLKFRNTIVPVVNIGSRLAWPILLVGIALISAGSYTNGNLLFDIGIVLFLGVVVFHAVTLPVELNASSRAIAQLNQLGIIMPEENSGAKKVLRAAAMTYLAALASAVANLLRLLMIRRRQ